MKAKRTDPVPEPEYRLGHCCGCQVFPITLYRVGRDRYRCATCYEQETGRWPHLAPPKAEYERMQRECGR